MTLNMPSLNNEIQLVPSRSHDVKGLMPQPKEAQVLDTHPHPYSHTHTHTQDSDALTCTVGLL